MSLNTFNSIIIIGPTGSGKTDLSIKLAKLLNGEIVNADSMQIYKDLDIGTAKPTINEQKQVQHHLLDIKEYDEEFSVSEYKKLASNICEVLIKNGKTPIIVGGTGFFVNSLISNLNYGDSKKDEAIRNKYFNLALENGNEYVFNILKEKDPESASKLHFNDLKRVVRALEIYEITGIKKSELKPKKEVSILKPLIIGLTWDRAELYNRINTRVDLMINNGLVEEVEKIYKLNPNKDYQSFKGIGYKELLQYFNNKITLDEAIDKIKLNSRHYAKRQLTWFNKMENVSWFNKSKIEDDKIINEILDIYNK